MISVLYLTRCRKRAKPSRICADRAAKVGKCPRCDLSICLQCKNSKTVAFCGGFFRVVILELDVAIGQLPRRLPRLHILTQGAVFEGKMENWEAGQIPALPPQRWWSESLGKGHWTVRPGRRRAGPKGRLLSPETSLDGHNRNGLRRAAGSEPQTHGCAPVRVPVLPLRNMAHEDRTWTPETICFES